MLPDTPLSAKLLSAFATMPLLAALKAVLAAVSVQSEASQLAPQVNHSPWKLRVSASLTVVTDTVNVALVTAALSGRALVSHCSRPLLTPYVLPERLRLTPTLAGPTQHWLKARLPYVVGVVLAAWALSLLAPAQMV
jgi:hypothetical protein